MLDIRVTIENDKVVIAGLNALGQKINKAAQRGLTRAGAGIYGEAFKWLQGPARSRIHIFTQKKEYYKESGKRKRTQLRGLTDSLEARPGSYPVPRVTGHLLRMLNWLKPGETKAANNISFTAAQNEAIIYDAASYADTIFSGKGTSETYGPRDALKDGLEVFNMGAHIRQIMEEEIQRDLNVG